jgi:hypothetical protein
MASMLGPVYRYDPSSSTTGKLPAYFDGRLFIFDFKRSVVHSVQTDADGKVLSVERFWDQTTTKPIQNPIDCKVGPDGALYFLNWADGGLHPHNEGHGSLVKLEYTGPASPIEPRTIRSPRVAVPGWALLPPGARWIPAATALKAEAFDARGRRAWSWSQGSPAPQAASLGMLRVRMQIR